MTRAAAVAVRAPRRVAAALLAAALLVAALLLAVYATLAATVLVVLPAGGRAAVVLRNAWPVGQVPPGAYVYASPAPVDYSLPGRLVEAVWAAPPGAVVQVVAGPTAAVRTDQDGYLVVDGTRTRFRGPVTPQNLTRRYLAACVAGDCRPGQFVFLAQDRVLGEVKGFLGPTGVASPARPVGPRG